VRKEDVLPLVRELVTTGYSTLNGCGDNTRNVMAPPLAKRSRIFDAHAWAQAISDRFRIDMDPHLRIFAIDPNYVRQPEDEQAKQEGQQKKSGQQKRFDYGQKMLNRKFKMGLSGFYEHPDGRIERDNSVEVLTNDVAVVPLLNEDRTVDRFQVSLGGGQGEKNNKPTFAALAQPFGIFHEDHLLDGLHAIVETHKEWGDRKNRHWARLKYVLHEQGMDWFRQKVEEQGVPFEAPNEELHPGPRYLYHGWHELPDGKLAYGAYIENGRLIDGADGSLKSMVRDLMEQFDLELSITPNQDILLSGIDPEQKEAFEQRMIAHGYGTRNGSEYSTLRKRSGSCVGLYTCRLAYAESEQFEPVLLDQLEEMGYGDLFESVGITGCERQCFRPGTKSIGWVGSGPRHYSLKLGGSEDGSSQGTWFTDGEAWYLRKVAREQVPTVTAALFDFFLEKRQEGEDFGAFHSRLGNRPFIEYLASREDTADLMKRGMRPPYLTEQLQEVVQGDNAFKNGDRE
jgi:sulfite reductase (NADPH) hemoprotein beta-component